MSIRTWFAPCRLYASPPRRRLYAFLALAATLIAVAASAHATRAQGITFLVDHTDDAPDAAPGDGACAATGGGCTLRAAVQEANALPGADVVELPAGTFALSFVGAGDIGTPGDLDVTDDLALRGVGAEATEIDARAVQQAVSAWYPASLDISALRIAGSQLDDSYARWRAAVSSGGGLTLTDVTIEGGTGFGVSYGSTVPGRIERSVIRGHRSGGIRTADPLHLVDSRIEDNGPIDGSRAVDAAGIWADADVYIERSVLAGNRPLAIGGSYGRAHLTVRDSTFVDNGVDGRLTAVNTTFDGASPLGLVSGSELTNVTLAGASGTDALVALGGGIVLANTAIGGSCRLRAAVFSGGGNVATSGDCAAAVPDIRIVPDLLLAPLADNGGPTWTRLPLAASPLHGVGVAPRCTAFDQRGFPRPPGTTCDSGAVEAEATGAGAPTPTPHDWANGPAPWSTGQPHATSVPVTLRTAFGLDVVAQAGGASRALVLDGDRAWVSVGAWLVALDRSDPARPIELGRLLLPELVVGLARDADSGRIAALTTGALAVVDAADPAHLTRVAWLPLPPFPGGPDAPARSPSGGVAVAAGGVAVVTGDAVPYGGGGRIAVWIATIGQGTPRWRGTARPEIGYGMSGGSLPPLGWPVAAGGGRAWVGTGERLAVLDVADPDAPRVVDTVDLGARVTALARDGDRLFAALLLTAGRPFNPLAELAVLDVSASGPVQRNREPLRIPAADALAAHAGAVVVLCSRCRTPLIQTIARGPDDALASADAVRIARHVRALAPSGNDVVFALGDGGIGVWLPSARDGELARLWDPPGPAADVVGDGDWLAWTTSLVPGEAFRAPDLEIVEPGADPLRRTAAWSAPHRTRPQAPRPGRIDLVGPESGQLVASGAGLWAVDLADRAAPAVRLLADRNVGDAAGDGATAWIVEDGRAEAMDVRGPGAAQTLGFLRDAGSRIVGLELDAGRLVARHENGPIAVYDAASRADPQAPRGVFSRSVSGLDGQAILHDGFLVVAEGGFSVSPWDGEGLAESGRRTFGLAWPSDVRGVTPDGPLLWIADGWLGVKVLDVTDPSRPVMAARMRIPGEALRIALAGDRVLVAAGDGGVVVLRRTALVGKAWLPWAGAER